METKLREYSQLEMLQDQAVRCDEELLILMKRRIQTCKKMAELVKKQGIDSKELQDISDKIFSKAVTRSKEMGLTCMSVHDLFGIIDDECKSAQEAVFNKK